MFIDKKLIEEYAKKNIFLRFHFDNDDDYYQKMYDYRFDWLKTWYTKDEYNNTDKTEEQLLQERKKQAEFYADKDLKDWQNATVLWVFMPELQFCIKNIGKYKGVTKDFIDKKIEKEIKKYNSPFGNFAKLMHEFLQTKNLEGWSIYPTTYGIGIWTIFNYKAEENAKFVADILKRNFVDYRNEWSEAEWVYRFVISKKQANLQKLI